MKTALFCLLISSWAMACPSFVPQFKVAKSSFERAQFVVTAADRGPEVKIGDKQFFWNIKKRAWCEDLGKDNFNCDKKSIKLTEDGQIIGLISYGEPGDRGELRVYSVDKLGKKVTGRAFHFSADLENAADSKAGRNVNLVGAIYDWEKSAYRQKGILEYTKFYQYNSEGELRLLRLRSMARPQQDNVNIEDHHITAGGCSKAEVAPFGAEKRQTVWTIPETQR